MVLNLLYCIKYYGECYIDEEFPTYLLNGKCFFVEINITAGKFCSLII